MPPTQSRPASRRASRPAGLTALALALWRIPPLRLPIVLLVAGFLAVELHNNDGLFPPAVPYHRDLYPHWLDADRDCRDTRSEVLIRDSLVPPRLGADGCRVLAGEWRDVYTGRTVRNPKALDIDHRVPLAEAHRSGGDRWTPEQRRAFANDLSDRHTLVAVSARANRAKGDGDPVDWMPPDLGDWCDYVDQWIAVKRRWELRRDPVEWLWTEAVAAACRL